MAHILLLTTSIHILPVHSTAFFPSLLSRSKQPASQQQKPIMNIPIPIPGGSDNKDDKPSADTGDLAISDIIGTERSINIFAGFTRMPSALPQLGCSLLMVTQEISIAYRNAWTINPSKPLYWLLSIQRSRSCRESRGKIRKTITPWARKRTKVGRAKIAQPGICGDSWKPIRSQSARGKRVRKYNHYEERLSGGRPKMVRKWYVNPC